MSTMSESLMTNQSFAARVGCDFTMASRLRNGVRLPSARLLSKIVREFELDWDETMAAYDAGEAAFGKFIRTKIYQDAA